MKSLFCILAIVLCSSVVFGQKEPDKNTDKTTNKQTSNPSQLKGSKPPIEMPKTLKIMEKFIKKQKIDTFELLFVESQYYSVRREKRPETRVVFQMRKD